MSSYMKIPPSTLATDDYQYNVGSHHFQIFTHEPQAQTWFNRGLIWCYAFHHEEAARCFKRAMAEDPDCAMARWGLAFALGPNYNKPWDLFDEEELKTTITIIRDANREAKSLVDGPHTTDLEKALIEAVQLRVPDGTDEEAFRVCNEAYALAMESVYALYEDNLDVAALYADAIMNLSAWDLWDLKTGEPTYGARSLEAKEVLEKALRNKRAYKHPGVLHQYVHLMEMSKTPEAAMVAADHLRTLVPDAGHLVHMPSHLDILVGDYTKAIASNVDACLADEKYLKDYGGDNFYSFYRMHDYHSLIYAAMFAGHSEMALSAVCRLEKSLPTSLLRIKSPPMADWLENFASVRVHVLVRFGMWKDLIALPDLKDKELYCVTTAMVHYGKGIAYAATNDIPNAEKQRDALVKAVEKIPASRICGDFPNRSNVVLQVGVAMLDGELEYRKGNFALAFQHLETAIERDDNLTYAEPWPWMMPTRHAYAALLMEQGRVEDAAAAYRADLGFDQTLPRARQHPNNLWALHGYRECMVWLGRVEEAEAVARKLEEAKKLADVEVRGSCYCRGV